MAKLSPAARAVMAAATRNTALQTDPVYRECIAAALRELANQISFKDELGLTAYGGHAQAQHQILAIVAELRREETSHD